MNGQLLPDALPTETPIEAPARAALPLGELVVMVAALMALNALGIDLMLPALGAIARDLDAPSANDQQLVVVAYVLGIGVPQLVFGSLADRFGRRPTLFISLLGYAVAGLACVFAHELAFMLTMRFLQGAFASGCRVVAFTVVRDLHSGRAMARILSLVMTVFMVVPILAPALGQVILFVAPWQWCFAVLAVAGAVMLVWTFVRLPETLAPSERRPMDVRSMASAYATVLRNRTTLGYMLASGVIFGSLFAFIAMAEQVFREVFDQHESFVLWFAGVAIMLSIANFANSRLVERFGMRRLSHLALVAFVAVSLVLYLATSFVGDRLFVFYPLFALAFGFFGLIGANFNALAMEPLGKIAGTAASAFGFTTTTISGLIGGAIGRAYDGTTKPLVLGFVTLGLIAFGVLAVTDRKRLFAVD